MAHRSKKRRRRRKPPRFAFLTYLLLRAGAGIISWIPTGISLPLARLCGRVGYHLDGKHRRIARDNVEAAYGDSITPEEKDRIVLGSFQNLTLNVVEMIHAIRLVRRGRDGSILDIQGRENVRERLSSGRGVICAAGHLSNWELLAISMQQMGYDAYTIAATQRNPYIDRLVEQARLILGNRAIPKKGALRRCIEVLREGCSLGILMDQNQRREGIFVEFFGRKASTIRAVALLSRKTGAPIVTVILQRMPGKIRHRIEFQKPILPIRTDDPEEDVLRMTEEVTGRLEAAIRAHPDQWLWLHRRWRTRPPEEGGKVAKPSLARA